MKGTDKQVQLYEVSIEEQLSRNVCTKEEGKISQNKGLAKEYEILTLMHQRRYKHTGITMLYPQRNRKRGRNKETQSE